MGATNKPSGEELEAREELAVSLSERERQILEVERQAVDLFSAALMEPLTGEEFEGTVHTVMALWGLCEIGSSLRGGAHSVYGRRRLGGRRH